MSQLQCEADGCKPVTDTKERGNTMHKRYSIEKTFSRDDGGWYCEVIDRATGATVYTTDVYLTSREALADAQGWRVANNPCDCPACRK